VFTIPDPCNILCRSGLNLDRPDGTMRPHAAVE
jgi:hypothetical protein